MFARAFFILKSISMNKNICVFCSSSDHLPEKYYEAAKELGTVIGISGDNIVYGGTSVGLMHAAAFATKQSGGKVIGVIPELIQSKGIASDYADELIVTTDMKERKEVIREKSDAFIALPGSFGTLEEIMEVITLKQLAYHSKAIVFVDVDGFYAALKAQFDMQYQEKFANESFRKMYVFVDNAEEALDYINKYSVTDQVAKWD
jgi:uncharacterized protein (TIGR00730 family)